MQKITGDLHVIWKEKSSLSFPHSSFDNGSQLNYNNDELSKASRQDIGGKLNFIRGWDITKVLSSKEIHYLSRGNMAGSELGKTPEGEARGGLPLARGKSKRGYMPW